MNDALFEKLRKIKALADDAKDDNEARVAMMMFQQLLSKNGLSESEIDLAESQADEAVTETDIHDGARIAKWLLVLHVVMAQHFRCVPLSKKGKGRTTLAFVGHKSDTLIAQQAFNAARTAAERLASEYKLRCLEDEAFGIKHDPFNKNDYMTGFVLGLERAYKQQEASSELGLIIVTPPDVLAAVADFPNESTRLQLGGSDSTQAGYEDGKNVGRGNVLRKDTKKPMAALGA